MPGSGKSALLKQMRMALAAPGDLCVCYRFGTGSETADEHERTLTDYALFPGLRRARRE